MRKAWTDDGWADYVYWQSEDKRTLKERKEVGYMSKSVFICSENFCFRMHIS